MTTRHFRTLDALRGISALAVVLYHLPVGGIASRGYLAVDLFFLMSGFVVAYAYEARLVAGWSAGQFLLARVRRLWPLYAVGIVLGVLCYGLAQSIGPANGVAVPALPTLSIVVLNLLFLPWTGMAKWPSFPLNSPAWSLSVEMVGNVVYGVVARVLSDETLKVLTVLGAFGLCLIVYLNHGLDVGVDASNAFGGYVRFAFSFPLGVLLCRLHRDRRLQKVGVAWPVVLLLAAAVFAGFMPFGGAGDLVAVMFVFPLLLVSSLTSEPAAPTAAWFGWVGAVSYPLYIVHHPLLDVLKALHPPVFAWWLAVPAVIAAAAVLERLFDAPVQRRLAAALGQNRASA